jgi:rod shape determining protein RodA
VFRTVDWFTIGLYVVLVIMGAVSIYAASYDFTSDASFFSFASFSGKQLRWIGLSLVLGLMILLSDYRIYETYAYVFYAVMLMVLAVTIFVAPDIKGSHSWLVFGPVSMQPAEFAKIATALALAKLMSSYNFKLNAKMSNYAQTIGIIFVPILLIFLQRETGSALAYLALFFVLYREGMSGLVLLAALVAVTVFVVTVKYTDSTLMNMAKGEFIVLTLIMFLMTALSGIYARSQEMMRNFTIGFAALIGLAWLSTSLGLLLPWKYIFIAVIVIASIYSLLMALRNHIRKLMACAIFGLGSILFMSSVTVIFDHMAPHQQSRILVSLGITADPRGAGYNVNQSMIAIGSGGVKGKGFLNGTQTKLKYVPEQHTDFIFCTIGEEEGYWGTSLVLILFCTLICRLIFLAERQPGTFGRVYGYSVVSLLIFHLLINVGMVIGLCPVIGIPLPFFSYGGSSLWGFTILLFVMLRLDAARRQMPGN